MVLVRQLQLPASVEDAAVFNLVPEKKKNNKKG